MTRNSSWRRRHQALMKAWRRLERMDEQKQVRHRKRLLEDLKALELETQDEDAR